jgi:hypothetical protein
MKFSPLTETKTQLFLLIKLMPPQRKDVTSRIVSIIYHHWRRMAVPLCIKWFQSNEKLVEIDRITHYKGYISVIA